MHIFSRRKSGIRRKITLLISLSSFAVMLLSIALVYFLGTKLLEGVIVSGYTEIARILGEDISEMIDKEVVQLTSYVETALWQKDISGSGKDLSVLLSKFKEDDEDLTRVSLTDIEGKLIASTDGVGFASGIKPEQMKDLALRGRVFVGDVFLDERSGNWLIPVDIPVRNSSGKVTAVCRAELSTKRFFDRLGQIKIGASARAVLADELGNIVYHSEIKPMAVKLISEVDLARLLSSKRRYEIVSDPLSPLQKRVVVFADIKLPQLLGDNVVRRVFIQQDAAEVFAPLSKLVGYLALVMGISIIVLLTAGFFLGGLFVRPILRLQEATKHISSGDLDYKIDIRTQDELQQLAEDFQGMAANIKTHEQELLSAKIELEGLTKGLEDKVQERTKELTEAKNKLEEALAIKSHFTSMVSHELRTPLAAIKESISVVLEKLVGDISPEQEKCLAIASRNVERLIRLINEILDFQKLESGKMVFHMQPNDINAAGQEVVETMLPLAKEKGLELKFEGGENLPRFKFDKDKITQVMLNLVNNAIKFTQEGSITVSTSRGDNFVQVTVRDTGTGIKEEDLSKLFKQFSQIETPDHKKAGGTGLGLAISLEIIEAHHGKIWPESTFGKGTVVHFILPIEERRRDYAQKYIVR